MKIEDIKNYTDKLSMAMQMDVMHQQVPQLAEAILEAWRHKRSIYFCGNGGSAGNAMHIANDFIYGAGIKNGGGIRVEALTANSSVLTCLANDVGYDHVFSEQLKVKANPGDLLIAFSGSGNSPNIINAIEVGNKMGMNTFAVLGYSGGRCKEIVQNPIHFDVNDMQIAEDLQLVVGHICMQWLSEQKVSN